VLENICQTVLAFSSIGLERGRPARLCALGNQTSLEGTPRCVGEHLPNRFGVQFKLVRFYYAQRRAERPHSNPSPLRGKLATVIFRNIRQIT
jgi:hypothetical protein